MMHSEQTTSWTAVILAAGRGKRMGGDRAKVLQEVAGRTMLSWVIDAARDAGATKVVVVVGYDRESVIASLPEGTEWVVQDVPQGTGDAVRAASGALAGMQGNVWILCGDVPGTSAETLLKLARLHEDTGASCTLLTMELEDPRRYGRVMRSATGHVERIVEFADASEEERSIRELNSGTYAFSIPDLLATLPRLSNANAQGEYYLTDMVGLLIGDGKLVAAHKTQDPRECMGGDTPEALGAIRSAWGAKCGGE
jgi:bifunctional UDP-N-acetylglucosamine pyrophosphorylase/glucosamine-1-phosphate N-acetyltransferase